jgi:hypothetical protein
MRFRRALDRGNVTEALSAASELQFVSLADALELTLLLADKQPEKYERAAARWHVRFLQEVPNVDFREDQAVLALLPALPVNRLAAAALAELPAAGALANEPVRRLSAGRGRRKNRCAVAQNSTPELPESSNAIRYRCGTRSCQRRSQSDESFAARSGRRARIRVRARSQALWS